MSNQYQGSPEAKARHEKINPKLRAAGWDIQNYRAADIRSSTGVAVEYFQIGKEQADYILFVRGIAVGVIEAKKEGVTLIPVLNTCKNLSTR